MCLYLYMCISTALDCRSRCQSPVIDRFDPFHVRRQFHYRVGADNMCVIHVSYVPVLGVVGEQKTKPTQHSVQTLRSLGLHPTLLCCRAEARLETSVRDKLAMFCHASYCDCCWCGL